MLETLININKIDPDLKEIVNKIINKKRISEEEGLIFYKKIIYLVTWLTS